MFPSLNVCVLAYTFYESDGRVIRYARALAELGATVDVIALGRPGQSREEEIDGVHVMRVQYREKNERSKLTYLWRILAFFLRSAWVVARRNRARRYHLVHAHSVPDFEVFASIFAKISGAKIILDIHDIVPEFYAAKFGKKCEGGMFRLLVAVERASASYSDHVIIANDLWRGRLVQRSVPAEKCTSIINYPDLRVFKADLRTRNHDGRFLIVYPGSLNYHQGLDIALAAVTFVRAELPNMRFEIYGDGPERERLKAMIDELGLVGTVELCAARPLHEIAGIMANADLAVVPKRDDSFGGDAFSTKILEFMAVGVPVVVADTRIDRHYFDETLVRFFRAGDPRDLAATIVRAVREEGETKTRVLAARQFVQQNSWERKKSVYIDLVQRLTSG